MAVGRTITGFKGDLAKFAKILEVDISKVRRKIAFDIWRGVDEKSPVDSGRFRFAWGMADGSPSAHNPDKGTYNSMGPVEADFAKPFDRTWITNPMPYAEALEFEGHSKQAPNGMMRITLAEVEASLSARINVDAL